MNKLILSSIVLLILTACGGSSDKKNSENKSGSTESAVVKTPEKISCDYLTDAYVQKAFSGATDVVKNKYISGEKSCAYNFKLNNEKHSVSLILQGTDIKEVFDADLDHYIKYMKGSVLISGVGERAFYSKSMAVLTANSKHTIVQVSTSNLEWAKKVTNDMLLAIEK